MKKLLAMILCAVMVFSFAACSETEKAEVEAITITPERGTVENGIYENTTFGVKFEAGENWYFLSDDEIAMAMGVAAEEMFGEGTEITGDKI